MSPGDAGDLGLSKFARRRHKFFSTANNVLSIVPENRTDRAAALNGAPSARSDSKANLRNDGL